MRVPDGKYGGVFEGEFGTGILWVTLHNGRMVARDANGNTYDGTHEYDPATGINTFCGEILVRPGKTLVTDPRARAGFELVRYEARMRGEELGTPVDATTAFGTVRLTLRPETA